MAVGVCDVACYRPQPAVRLSDGTVKFVSRDHPKKEVDLVLPCGQCIGCRLERARSWAVRCVHESRLHESNCFVTLTYDDSNLPAGGSLDYPEFQRFMKRLRKSVGSVRFYMGGEYGDQLLRPHYHVIIFGYDFPDKVFFKRSNSGERIYTSEILSRLWPFGLSSIGAVTFESAAYIARYCVQKVNGDLAKSHYETFTSDGEIIYRCPEFNHMSLKPGIGAGFFERFYSDIFPRDYTVINGTKHKLPGYYDVLLERRDPDLLESLKWQRELDMQILQSSNPDEFLRSYWSAVSGNYNHDRLSVKERFFEHTTSNFSRNLS